jgi:hypothetical protein
MIERFSAIIIEPRPHDAFQLVLENFLTHLDNNWDIIIFHGNLNKEYLTNLIDFHFEKYKPRIKMIHLDINNLSISNYNKLMRCKKLYDYITTDVFLLFQLDTLISDKYNNTVYDYIQYDYVGAPWGDTVGNGGLSLRRKTKMLEIINTYTWLSEDDYEDKVFSNYWAENFFPQLCIKVYKPSASDAKLFSVETTFSPCSFGIHKVWDYASDAELQQISEHIPRIYELKDIFRSYQSDVKHDDIKDINLIFPK